MIPLLAGSVIVWPWWCQPWSAAKLHLRLLQGPNSWLIQNVIPALFLCYPPLCEDKTSFPEQGQGLQRLFQLEIWRENRDFLKLWLSSEVSWSAAGEEDASGPLRCGLLWSSEQELCVVLTCHPAFRAGLGHPLFLEVQCSVVKEWNHVTCYYMCVFVLLFLSFCFRSTANSQNLRKGSWKSVLYFQSVALLLVRNRQD